MFKKRKKEYIPPQVMEGLVLDTKDGWDTENRFMTLLIKAIIIYFIVMGTMGGIYSAIGTHYDLIEVNIGVFLFCLYVASLYYSTFWQNAGYILLLLIMIVGAVFLWRYINSGFYVMINDMSEIATAYFDSKVLRSYGEQITDRYLTATIAMIYIGGAMATVCNVLISRVMNYVYLTISSLVVLLFPLYLEREPDIFYMAMLMTGLVMIYLFRGNEHFGLTNDNNIFKFVDNSKKKIFKRKSKITYVYDFKSYIKVLAAIFVFSLILLAGINTAISPFTFHQKVSTTAWKEENANTMENLYMVGLMGLFNRYQSTGGLRSGKLGGINAVVLDYETDLEVTFEPYTADRIYLKSFVGHRYIPIANRWEKLTKISEKGDIIEADDSLDATTKALKKNYEKKKTEKSAKATMIVKNVAADESRYMPYYSPNISLDDYTVPLLEERKYYFYPLFENQLDLGNEDGDDVPELSLIVPEENQECLAEFCEEAGLKKGMEADEVTLILKKYYRDNIPYTYEPGATPDKRDFVNYFLKENRKGYCAHFASAATLIYRYLGIPARYIEGYSVDPSDIAEEGKIVAENDYKKILGKDKAYDGYSYVEDRELVKLVKVPLSDANAHAWVEVYNEKLGWHVEELTPPASPKERARTSIWQDLANFFGGGNSRNYAQEDSQELLGGGEGETGKITLLGLFILLAIIGIIFFILYLIKWIKAHRIYVKASLNGKLMIKYNAYLKRISRKNKDIKSCKNIREEMEWLQENGKIKSDMSLENRTNIMERAAFSDKEISLEEYNDMKNIFLD